MCNKNLGRVSVGGDVMRKFGVVIPAFRPMKELTEYVQHLSLQGVPQIIVVNDGSEEAYDAIFAKIAKIENCTVLNNELNSGKGASLKKGFTYFLEHFSHLKGIVTADADGQHAADDVLAVGDKLATLNEGFVLGSRVFKRKDMPIRSWIGNRFTSFIFKILFGRYIRDTQTGLRGITTIELDWVNQLYGDRFEYEMNMLINMIRKDKHIVRVDIKALYAEEHTSHFETFKDAKLIAQLIVKNIFNVTQS